MRKLYIALYVLTCFSVVQGQNYTNNPLSFGINLGGNISHLRIDTADENGVLLPLAGINLNYSTSENFDLLFGAQFSYRGSNTSKPVYHYRNEYIDLQLMPRFKPSSNIILELGLQRTILLNSYYKVKDPFSVFDNQIFNTKGFKSHTEFIFGGGIKLAKGVELLLRYTIPIKELEYSNIAMSLNILFYSWKFNDKLISYSDIIAAGKEPKAVEQLIIHREGLKTFPIEITQMLNLQELTLNANEITSLPSEIGNLKNLTKLSLKYNKLDSLPKEIGQLTNLEELYLNHNNLTTLPEEIKNLKKLKYLHIGKNDFTEIPEGISYLTNLIELDLCNSGNMLTIPASFKNLKNLEILYIDRSALLLFDPQAINPRLKVIVK